MLRAMIDLADTEKTEVVEELFGSLADGMDVGLYTLTNGAVKAKLTNFGARLVSLEAPDRDGVMADVVLGLGTLEEYVEDRSSYLGAIVGRFGNRIAEGSFSLNGQSYQVPRNDHGNALHGGKEGFDRKVWAGRVVEAGVEFTLVSRDGDQGFPGTLKLVATYTLVGEELRIEYVATTHEDTVVNVTNHAYFNLAGESSGTILGQEMMIRAASYTPTDAKLIPTGELSPVDGTPFDFRASTVIGERIEAEDEQLKRAGGYDHNWVLSGAAGELKIAAQLRDRASGRVLTVETTEPGVQFYSGNFLNGALRSRAGGRYARRTGLCLETQHFPDSPNQRHFPTTVLKAGETMRSTTVFRFGVEA